MKGFRLFVLAGVTLAAACSTQAPPTGELNGRLARVYDGDHGEWLKYESAADRDLDTAHAALRHMQADHYWNITEMQERADAAAADAAQMSAKAEEVHKRILDKRLHYLESIHVTEKDIQEYIAFASFRTGSSSPQKVQRKEIPEIIATLRRYPVGYAEVRGYTDTKGNPARNKRLAAARANAVKSILHANGANNVHVVTIAIGEAEGPDNTADPKNRRVDVVMVPHGKAPR